jgi:hypothetical protein
LAKKTNTVFSFKDRFLLFISYFENKGFYLHNGEWGSGHLWCGCAWRRRGRVHKGGIFMQANGACCQQAAAGTHWTAARGFPFWVFSQVFSAFCWPEQTLHALEKGCGGCEAVAICADYGAST